MRSLFRYRLVWLFVMISITISGCQPSGSLTRIPTHGTILAFGDSLTYGLGTTRDKSYPSQLAKLSKRRVINAGVPGETTQEGLARLPKVLARTHPRLLILLEGGNDILDGLNLHQTEQNLNAMVRLAKKHRVPVLLIGVPTASWFSNVAPFYHAVARENKVMLESRLMTNLLRDPSYKSDLFHLNAEGYLAMAQAIHQRLVAAGALKR